MTAILSAATQPQAVGLFADGRIEPWDPTQEIVAETLPDHLWIWSAVAPPVRLSAREVRGGPPLLLPAARWVRVSTLTDGAGDERYRLHAAPAEMWAEVPEPLLPNWEMDSALPFVLPAEHKRAWRLRAVGESTASGWVDVASDATAADLTVMPASPVSSRLVTDRGLPVAAADARLRLTGGPLDTVETIAIWRADHKGVLTLPPAPRNGSLDLRFEAGGVVARQIHTTPVAFPETIVLTTGRVLNGVVVQTDGTGIPGAHVGYETWLPGQGGLLRRSALSDEAGRWRISGVAEGRFSLRFEASGFAPSTQIHTAADEVEPLRAVLSPAASRTVEVVDDTGFPVAQAGITGSGGITASSDESGLAVLGGIAEDRQLVLHVDASGHLPSRTTRRPPLPDPVTVTLERSFSVRGRFVSPRGEPLAAGRLVVETSSGLRTLELAGDAGFEIDLPPGEEATLHLFSRDSAPLHHELQAGEPGEVRELGDLPAPPSL
ncbi:MAG TPA: carboxypeptidase-like regulatory domain-containing protein, partial [Thermoanaerobaculia bacterium]|nr:carboxypeptidase-like regulatory domain-containing protein [Thermoanaerobaculia bacterium]